MTAIVKARRFYMNLDTRGFHTMGIHYLIARLVSLSIYILLYLLYTMYIYRDVYIVTLFQYKTFEHRYPLFNDLV